MKGIFIIAGGIILAVVVLAGWSDFMRGLHPALQDINRAVNTSNGVMASTPAVPGSQWTYTAPEDDMSGKAERQAAVKSTNTLEFRFPYQNPQRATLWLRTHPRYGKNVMVQIERGQFLCPSYDGCTVMVRFDEGSGMKYSAAPPADHSSDNVFIRNYQSFVSRMLKAKRVRIEADFYQEGRPTLDFDVSGFDQAKYNPEPQPKQRRAAAR